MAETCVIFVDDSNVWIEAQKFRASGKGRLPKLQDRDQDPRYRVDIGQLVRTISGYRSVKNAFLYGSRPPPNDAVWHSYERFGFKVNIYNRADNGKEKQVDNSMATDISREATELKVGAKYDSKIKQELDNMTFIVISGDRDMLPPITAALECNIRVEVWAWKSGISNEHKKRAGGNLQVCYLDQIADRIFFTNTRSTRQGKKLEVDRTIVLCDPRIKDKDMNCLETSVSNTLLATCDVLFYITQSQTEPELFVEFPNLKSVESMILTIREQFKGEWRVESWPEYASRRNKKKLLALERGNMFSPLVNEGQNAYPAVDRQQDTELVNHGLTPSPWDLRTAEEQQASGAGTNEDFSNWETVKSRNDPRADHRRFMQRKQVCRDGLRCRKASNCTYGHTRQETNLFEEYPFQNFAKWKTSECRNLAFCQKGKKCPFAHSEAEAWCQKCYKEGHYVSGCEFGTSGHV
ncbi:hypothetical protein CC79DRAFT_1306161 [Sarocladium strictum]